MFNPKISHHLRSVLLSLISCTLFISICFILSYKIYESSQELNVHQSIASNDVEFEGNRFFITGDDPYIVYAIEGSLKDFPLNAQITFSDTYTQNIDLSAYYAGDDMAFNEVSKSFGVLESGEHTIFLNIPNNTRYLRLDIDTLAVKPNSFQVESINLFNPISGIGLFFIFIAYAKYVLILGSVFIIVSVFWIRAEAGNGRSKRIIIVVYASFMLLLIGKALLYGGHIAYVPDESAHIAYIVYEKEHPTEFVPHFENMQYSYFDTEGDNIYNAYPIQGNYLGHPPLYYKIMSGLGMVRIIEEGISAYMNGHGMSIANIIIVCIGMLLYFHIGFTRLPCSKSSISLHLLYAAICTGIPMVSFTASGCSNDNLLYIGFGFFLLGVIRYFEDSRNIGTYLLVSIGTSVCLLTKLTAGAMVIIMIAMLLITDAIQSKKLRMVTNRNFLYSLPIYGIPAFYFAALHYRYGTIQPRLAIINPDFYYTSGWYVPIEERTIYSFGETVRHFFEILFGTWSCIYNGEISFAKKSFSFWWWPFVLLIFIAFVGGVYSLRQCIIKRDNGKYIWCFAAMTGIIAMLALNFMFVYSEYLSSGYFGGMQGRYYMFAVPALAFLNVILYEDILKHAKSFKLKLGINGIIVLYSIWLIGGDLPFSLIYCSSVF